MERRIEPRELARRPSAAERDATYVTTSWDDGHVDDLRLAELLGAYGLPATFYIAPRNCELPRSARLRDRDIADLATRFEIGGHTLTHLRLPTLDDGRAAREISSGKSYLEDCAGRALTSFCYPGGAYEPCHLDMVRAAGFEVARTIERLRIDPPASLMEVPTTFHAYRHLVDGRAALRMAGGRGLLAARYYLNWDSWAMALFDRAVVLGGIFHLWGHSWEISERGDWRRLERVLAHISRHPNVTYIDNGALAAVASQSGAGDAP